MTVSQQMLNRIRSRFNDGTVPSEIYSDHELYLAEQETVFANSWLFVGHEDMVPRSGDYITTYMGEDSVILTRDTSSQLQVLLNKCRHRGNKVCLFDRGHTNSFTCSYHGWTYGTDGALRGVPQERTAYISTVDRTTHSLKRARVANYHGLIFASWQTDIEPIDDYLGDMRWYLDTFVLYHGFGGLQLVPGRHRYNSPINWKLLAENFVGDHYHFPITHASLLSVLEDIPVTPAHLLALETVDTSFEVTIGKQCGVSHSIGQLLVGPQYKEEDLRQARLLGPDAVDWVQDRHRFIEVQLRDYPTKPYGFNRFNIFPNLSMVHATGALSAHSLLVWNPRGPMETETYQWCFVPRDAPDVVKQAGVRGIVQGQSVAGMLGTDDSENFSRISDNVHSTQAKHLAFDYTMGRGYEGSNHPMLQNGNLPSEFPGEIGYHTSEVSQRAFLRHWCDLLLAGGYAGAMIG